MGLGLFARRHRKSTRDILGALLLLGVAVPQGALHRLWDRSPVAAQSLPVRSPGRREREPWPIEADDAAGDLPAFLAASMPSHWRTLNRSGGGD